MLMPSQSPLRILSRFLITATVIFVVLILPWPGLRSFYAAGYRSGVDLLFRDFGKGGLVAVLPGHESGIPPPDGDRHKDTVMICLKQDVEVKEKVLAVFTDSWLTAYLPTAKLIALVLATPIAWHRRWSALFFGLILLYGFVAARVGLLLLYAYSTPSPYRLYEPAAFWMGVLSWLRENLALSTSALFLGPVLIWVLVTLRLDDVRKFHGGTPPAPPNERLLS